MNTIYRAINLDTLNKVNDLSILNDLINKFKKRRDISNSLYSDQTITLTLYECDHTPDFFSIKIAIWNGTNGTYQGCMNITANIKEQSIKCETSLEDIKRVYTDSLTYGKDVSLCDVLAKWFNKYGVNV